MLITVILFIFTIAIAATVLILESNFIKTRSKGRWIFPAIVTFAAILLVVNNSYYVTVRGGMSGTHVVEKDLSFSYVQGYDRETIAIGQLIVGNANNAKYIDLEYEDGKLVGSKEALEYEDEIEDYVKWFISDDFTGKSVTYGELQKIENSLNYKTSEKDFSLRLFLYSLVIYGILPAVMWGMYLVDSGKRRKKRETNKIKIEDL